ncbi:MAG TPA: potassium channel protein [Chromatiales bacterium]|nr:potassium channel protein [Thiotrichales bacterium]HIP67088.1 potassium channel protein [Chromatiales bacterium]
MDNIVFLILRRMRRPLITLTLVYSISVLGLVLIPGQDADGNLWHMDFFHAFYFVSYMSTTIGFGEIPYAFTDAQRLWVTLSMYAGVIAWLYAFGTILTLLQDKTFQQARAESKLARKIRNLTEPFYLICGYGETGSVLVRGLTDCCQHVVVIEIDEQRSHLVRLESLRDYVPVLHGDAEKPLHLQEAGLEHPLCRAVVAVTNSNEVNLKIAITSKLLHPDITVICRSDSHDVEKNMASFGTDYIFDPYDTFATYLDTALRVPCLYLLQTWLISGNEEQELDEPVYPPKEGHWIVCGYGEFGKAVYERLKNEGIEVKVIEADPEKMGAPEEGVIEGRGTEADTLLEANIEQASGLIAGTNNDANNLSIVVTARDLNPELFTIVRQNHSENSAIIDAADADMVMQPSKIIADKIRVLLGTPMLYQFISRAYNEQNDWACELISRISALVGEHVPRLEEITIDQNYAQAIVNTINRDETVLLGDLLRDPWHRDNELNCIVLMLERQDEHILLPSPETEIKKDDRLLVCTGRQGFTRLHWNLQHDDNLSYVRTGQVVKRGWLWRKFSKKMKS